MSREKLSEAVVATGCQPHRIEVDGRRGAMVRTKALFVIVWGLEGDIETPPNDLAIIIGSLPPADAARIETPWVAIRAACHRDRGRFVKISGRRFWKKALRILLDLAGPKAHLSTYPLGRDLPSHGDPSRVHRAHAIYLSTDSVTAVLASCMPGHGDAIGAESEPGLAGGEA